MQNISVTIPVFNESARIPQLLSSFSAQTYQDFEVTIVDNDSDDDSVNIVETFIPDADYPLKILHEKRKGVGYARDRGMSDAVSRNIPTLASTDADSVPPPHWLATIAALFKTTDCDCAFGLASFRTELFEQHTILVEKVNEYVHFRNTLARAITIPPRGVNLALTAKMYQKVGGVEQPLRKDGTWAAGEDILLNQKIQAVGGKIGHIDAVVATDPRRVFAALLENNTTDFHTQTIENPRNTQELATQIAALPESSLDALVTLSKTRYFKDFIVNHINDKLWEKASYFVSPYEDEFQADAKSLSLDALFEKYEPMIQKHIT